MEMHGSHLPVTAVRRYRLTASGSALSAQCSAATSRMSNMRIIYNPHMALVNATVFVHATRQ